MDEVPRTCAEEKERWDEDKPHAIALICPACLPLDQDVLEDSRKREELAQYCLDEADDALDRAKEAATSIGTVSAAGAGQDAVALLQAVAEAAVKRSHAQETLTLITRARETAERTYDDARLWHFGAGFTGGTALAAGGRAYTDAGVQLVYRLNFGFELAAQLTAAGLADESGFPQRLVARGLMGFGDASGWAFVAGLGTAMSTESARRQPLVLLTPFGVRYRWGNALGKTYSATPFAEIAVIVEPWIVSRASDALPESAMFLSVRGAIGLAGSRGAADTTWLKLGPERLKTPAPQ